MTHNTLGGGGVVLLGFFFLIFFFAFLKEGMGEGLGFLSIIINSAIEMFYVVQG